MQQTIDSYTPYLDLVYTKTETPIYGLRFNNDELFVLHGDTVQLDVYVATSPIIEENTYCECFYEEVTMPQEETTTESLAETTIPQEEITTELLKETTMMQENGIIKPEETTVVFGETERASYLRFNESFDELEENYEDSNLIWSSSNESVAAVGLNGVVYGRTLGVSIITVSTYDNMFTASCKVNVVEELPEETGESSMLLSASCLLSISPNTSWSDRPRHWAVEISASHTVNFDVYKCDNNGNYIGNEGDISSQVTWTSSDTSVATVDASGRVTGHKNGSTTISVKGSGFEVRNPIHVTVYTAYSSVRQGIAKSWANQYKSTVANCHDDRQAGTISPGTLLDLYGTSGNYVLGSVSGETAKYFLVASNLYDQTNGMVTICKNGTSDTRRHWDMYTTQTLKLSLTNGASATWTSSNSDIAKVNGGASATGATITINPVTQGTAYITANSGGKIDVIHVTVITKYTTTKMGITTYWCNKYKCSHTGCTIIDRNDGSTGLDKLIRIYGESGGFYYTNVVGENTYRYMWKENIQIQSWYRHCELENLNPGDSLGRYAPQGMAADSQYCYSFEIRGTSGAEEYHRLYRYDIETGQRIKMTPLGTVGNLWHANDAAIVRFNENGNSVPYIFVVAFSNSETNYIVKLGFNSSGQYWESARYRIPSSIRIAGITLISGGGTSPAIFLLKSGNVFYEATISNNKADESYVWDTMPSVKFTLGDNDVVQNTAQGIHYEESNDKLYLAYSGIKDANGEENYNKNKVYLYSNVKNASGVLSKSGSYEINREGASVLYYELECIGFRQNSSDNKLWFITFEGESRNGGVYADFEITR